MRVDGCLTPENLNIVHRKFLQFWRQGEQHIVFGTLGVQCGPLKKLQKLDFLWKIKLYAYGPVAMMYWILRITAFPRELMKPNVVMTCKEKKKCLSERGAVLLSRDVVRRIRDMCGLCLYKCCVGKRASQPMAVQCRMLVVLATLLARLYLLRRSFQIVVLEHFGSYWYNPLYCQLQASGHLDVMPFAFDSFDGCLVFVYNLPSHVILLTIRRCTHCAGTEKSGFYDTYISQVKVINLVTL